MSDDEYKTYHAKNGNQQNNTSACLVDDDHVEEGKDEVSSTNDNRDCRGLVETHEGKQSRRVVHERIETAELRNCEEVRTFATF